MQRSNRIGHLRVLSLLAIILAACAGQKEPAQKLIAEIRGDRYCRLGGGREVRAGSAHGCADQIRALSKRLSTSRITPRS